MAGLRRKRPLLRIWVIAALSICVGVLPSWRILTFTEPDVSTPGVDGIVLFVDSPGKSAAVTVGIESTGASRVPERKPAADAET
jgi:hypothetical protein